MSIIRHLTNQYEVNPMKIISWGVIMGCLAVMTGIIAAGAAQDKKIQVNVHQL